MRASVGTVMIAALLTLGCGAAPAVANTAPAQQAAGVGRGEVIDRAQVWVDRNIPHNSNATYGGYRTDCSGYVSMAWKLGANKQRTTHTLPGISKKIGKGSLKSGDILLHPQHVVIFHKWANKAKTKYVGYEMSSREGAVRHTIPYPYWNLSMTPYRYKHIG